MRWLHVSDLHIDPNGIEVDTEALMNRFLENLRDKLSEKPVDCIVFTGDLFNRGAWTSTQTVDAKALLKRIYTVCNLAGNWGWSDSQPMKRLFYCPGNHDVLREAYCVCDNNHVLHRKDVIALPSHISNNGQLTAVDDEYALLTEKTFGQFNDAMLDLCGDDTYSSSYKYEYRIFNVEDGRNQFNFIGINTALLAAQEYDADSITNELQSSFHEFLNYHTSFETKKALNAYKKYDIAANKKLGKLKNDKNNLCFISSKAQVAIQAAQKSNTIAILFGHHPINFLSQEASGRACLTAENNSIYLYLCGHMHKSHGENVNASYETYLGKLRDDLHLYQVTVGGLFSDQSGYNEISYSIGELVRGSGDQLFMSVSVFVYAKDVFGDFKWQTTSKSETITLKMHTQEMDGVQNDSESNSEQTNGNNLSTGYSQEPSLDQNDKKKDEHAFTIQNDKDFRSSMLTSLNLSESDNKKGG